MSGITNEVNVYEPHYELRNKDERMFDYILNNERGNAKELRIPIAWKLKRKQELLISSFVMAPFLRLFCHYCDYGMKNSMRQLSLMVLRLKS